MFDVLDILYILKVSYKYKIFKSNSIKMSSLMHAGLPTDLFTYYNWWIMCALTLPTEWSW